MNGTYKTEILFYMVGDKSRRRKCELTHSHTMTPFETPGKQAF